MKSIYLLLVITLLPFSVQAQEAPPAIHVEIRGQGAPLLLIPGFNVPGESWDEVVKELEQDYRCHLVTLAGFGGKAPIDFPWLPKVNAALEEYIISEELQDVTVIGHSLGGTIATWLASREKTEIAKIILIDALPATGALMFPDFNPDHLAYESPFNDQQLAMDDIAFAQVAAGMAQGMSLNPASQEQIKDWIIEADRKTYVYGYTDYLKLDVREDLKNINIPVTILAAEFPFGQEMVKQTYRNQYANLANYDLIIAEQSAHFIQFDRPQWFMDQLKLALSAHP